MYMQQEINEMTQEQPKKIASEGTIKTRFGEISYTAENVVGFPNGILGMPGQTNFAIAEMPAEKLKKFQVLQSLVDEETSFAVLPHDIMNEKIDQADLDEVCQVLEFDKSNLLVILIASIKRTAEKNVLTVNLRAPLFIDVEKKQGYQIVLNNSKYQVQHVLS